jgi:hypothetical protein
LLIVNSILLITNYRAQEKKRKQQNEASSKTPVKSIDLETGEIKYSWK